MRFTWWNTKLCRHFGAHGLAAVLWIEHFFPMPLAIPANDRDHLRW